jgi:hypothetical protein
LITSIVVSVPLGVYIWRQGRSKSSSRAHSEHGEHDHGKEHEEPKEESTQVESKPEKSGNSYKVNSKEMDDSQENVSAVALECWVYVPLTECLASKPQS